MFEAIDDCGSLTQGEVHQISIEVRDSDNTEWTGETLVGATGELVFRHAWGSSTVVLDASSFVAFPAANQVFIELPEADTRALQAGRSVYGNLFVTPVGSGKRFHLVRITRKVLFE